MKSTANNFFLKKKFENLFASKAVFLFQSTGSSGRDPSTPPSSVTQIWRKETKKQTF